MLPHEGELKLAEVACPVASAAIAACGIALSTMLAITVATTELARSLITLYLIVPTLLVTWPLRSVALRNAETIRVGKAWQMFGDGGRVTSWQTRRNGFRSG